MISSASDAKRQAILKAATRMFLAQGYRTVSMEKIAQAAPVSKATLYNHFDSKNALLAGVIAETCESLLQTMTLIRIDEGDMESTLNKIAASFVELIFSEKALSIHRLIIAESREFPELSRLFYSTGPQAALTQLAENLQQLKNKGQFQDVDSFFSADVFFSLLKGDLYLQCLLGIKPLPATEEKQRWIEQVVSFYMRGMDTTTWRNK